jgi:hypothetical protein
MRNLWRAHVFPKWSPPTVAQTTRAPETPPSTTDSGGVLVLAECGGRAAEQRYELAPLHSITSSAATSSLSGTVRPSILAVEALMTSSNLLD